MQHRRSSQGGKIAGVLGSARASHRMSKLVWGREDSPHCQWKVFNGTDPAVSIEFMVILLRVPDRVAVFKDNMARLPRLRSLSAVDASNEVRTWSLALTLRASLAQEPGLSTRCALSLFRPIFGRRSTSSRSALSTRCYSTRSR